MPEHQLHTQPRGERAARDLRGEVQDFMNRLARAIVSADGEAAAALWEVPALAIADERVIAIETPEQLVKFFGGVMAQYNARGVYGTRADIMDLERVGDRVVIVSVRWPYLDDRGKEVGAETSDYTLRRDDHGRLRIREVLMRGVEPRHS